MPGTVQLHRVLKAPPERVYRAFVTPEAMAKWLPPHGYTGAVHHFDARVGGQFKMSFTQFATQQSHGFGGEYLEMVPHTLLRYTNVFDDPNMPGVLQVTVHFKPVLFGTQLDITEAGIPDVIPVEMCHLGWQESLDQLARLVEPDIGA